MKYQQHEKRKGVGGGRGGDLPAERSPVFIFLGPSSSSSSSSSSADHSTTEGSSSAAGPADHQNPIVNNNNQPQLQQDGFQINPERPNIRRRIITITPTARMNNNPQLQQDGLKINQGRPYLRRRRAPTKATTTAAATTTTTTGAAVRLRRQQQYYRWQCPYHPRPLSPPPQINFSSTSIPRNNIDDYEDERLKSCLSRISDDQQSRTSSSSISSTFKHDDDYRKQCILWNRELERFPDHDY